MSDIPSLLLYIACFLFSASLLYVGIKRGSKVIRLLAILLPIGLVGLRVDVGTDYPSYVGLFQKYSGESIEGLLAAEEGEGVEIGFFALIKLAALLTGEPWMMFLLSAIITIGVAYIAIRRLSQEHAPLVFLLYMLILVPFTMNGVRQGIAVSIIFFAYTYIVRGSLAKYLLAIAAAALFHVSALALAPLYLLRFVVVKKRTDAPITLILSIVIALSAALVIPLALTLTSLIPAFSHYANYDGWVAGMARSTMLFMAVLSVVVAMVYGRMARKSVVFQLMAVLFFLEFASVFLGNVSAAFSRMSYYVAIGGLVYMSNISAAFSRNTKRYVQAAVIFGGIAYFMMYYYFASFSDIFPYNSIWSGGNG